MLDIEHPIPFSYFLRPGWASESDHTYAFLNLEGEFNARDGCVELPPGNLITGRSGWLVNVTRAGARFKIRGAPGTVLTVADQGVQAVGAALAEIEGLVLTRATQAKWGANKTGLHFLSCATARATGNEISKFTDAIAGEGTVAAPAGLFEATDNLLYLLGEEGVVSRVHVDRAKVEDNRITRHLGDAILFKGALDGSAMRNKIFAAARVGDADYASLTAGITDPLLPTMGGGITCNNESSEAGSTKLRIVSNDISDTLYGISCQGATKTKIDDNDIEKIWSGAAITFEDAVTAGNPASLPSTDFGITRNRISDLMKATTQTAIRARTGAVQVERGIIALNIIDCNNAAANGIDAKGAMTVSGNEIRRYYTAMLLDDRIAGSANFVLDEYAAGVGEAVSVGTGVSLSGMEVRSGVQVTFRGSGSMIEGRIDGQNASLAPVRVANGALDNLLFAHVTTPASAPVVYDTASDKDLNTILITRVVSTRRILEMTAGLFFLKTHAVEPRFQFSRGDIPGETWDFGRVLGDSPSGTQCRFMHNGNEVWVARVTDSIEFRQPLKIEPKTMAQLGSASAKPYYFAISADGYAGSPGPVWSDTVQWRRCDTNAVASTS